MILAGTAVGQILTSVDRSRGYAAARYLAARLGAARVQAVARGAAVALQFAEDPAGISFRVVQDGNRNGVRTADIDAGIDRPIEPRTSVSEQFPGVRFGVLPVLSSADPVQIGSSNLLTFTPEGTSTSGTLYLLDRQGTQWAVRVLGATGRTRVLRYDPRAARWHAAD